MNRMSRNLTTIYRTERLITQRRFVVMQRQAMLMVIAGIVALIALVLLNVAMFLLLSKGMAQVGAAAVLAGVNLAVAAAVATVASRMTAEEDIAPAVEMRDMAIADLENDLDQMIAEGRSVVDAIKGARADPLGSLASMLIPILVAVLKKKT